MTTPPGNQPPFDPNQPPFDPNQPSFDPNQGPYYPPPPPPAANYAPNYAPNHGPNYGMSPVPGAPYPPYPGMPVGGQPPAHRQAMTAMILGIVGLLCFSPAAPFAIWLGHKAMREIDASGGQLSGRGQAQAGFIMGIIGSVLLVLFMLLIFTGFFQGFVQGFEQGYSSTSGS